MGNQEAEGAAIGSNSFAQIQNSGAVVPCAWLQACVRELEEALQCKTKNKGTLLEMLDATINTSMVEGTAYANLSIRDGFSVLRSCSLLKCPCTF